MAEATSARTAAAHDDARSEIIPDRTPPATARQSRSRVQQVCVICGSPYLVAPALVRSYHTCSPQCSTELRCRSQRKRQSAIGDRRSTIGDDGAQATSGSEGRSSNAERRTPPQAEERMDVLLVGRGAVHVLCVSCKGLRGRWAARELPPPGLCWQCLWRRNAGLG